VPLRILRQLDLTDEQVETIQKVLETNKENAEASRKAIAEATKALHEATVKGDEAGIQEAATNLGKAIGKGAVLRASTMASVKKVLTEEQREKLEELAAKLKERADKLPQGMVGPELGRRFQGFGQRGGFRGQGMGAGRGPGMGPGRGFGMGPGRDWGEGQSPEIRDRGWGRGPAEEDFRRPRRGR
jgi:Spy/CpxP family protein refolding chaperone